MKNETTTVTIKDVLAELMFDKKIKMIDLAHITGVPQSTLSRILSGETTHPHRSSLDPLSVFFGISVSQLQGREPISFLRRLAHIGSEVTSVPLLRWEQVASWLTSVSNSVTEFIDVDMVLSEGSFAVTVDDAAMEPQFPRGTILVVDVQRPPKDRSFILASLGEQHKIIFRQLITDGLNRYLRSLNPDFSQFGMVTMTDSDQILGVVLQARKNYLE